MRLGGVLWGVVWSWVVLGEVLGGFWVREILKVFFSIYFFHSCTVRRAITKKAKLNSSIVRRATCSTQKTKIPLS